MSPNELFTISTSLKVTKNIKQESSMKDNNSAAHKFSTLESLRDLDGSDLVAMLRLDDENPVPYPKDTIASLIDKANGSLPANKLRAIVNWALRGGAHQMKFGSEADAKNFFEIASKARKTLQERGEDYDPNCSH